MAIYELPLKDTIATWLGPFPSAAQLELLRSRFLSALQQGGYTLGPAGYALTPGPPPMIRVELDRDPAADYASWNPATPSADEVAQLALRKKYQKGKQVCATIKASATASATDKVIAAFLDELLDALKVAGTLLDEP